MEMLERVLMGVTTEKEAKKSHLHLPSTFLHLSETGLRPELGRNTMRHESDPSHSQTRKPKEGMESPLAMPSAQMTLHQS